MSDLEQRIKEAAENVKDNGGALLFRADDIVALLAEKDAEIKRQRSIVGVLLETQGLHMGAADIISKFVGKANEAKDRAESAEREWDELKRIAGEYRETHSYAALTLLPVFEVCACRNCKAYDALVKGE